MQCLSYEVREFKKYIELEQIPSVFLVPAGHEETQFDPKINLLDSHKEQNRLFEHRPQELSNVVQAIFELLKS